MGNSNSSTTIEKKLIVPRDNEIAAMEDIDPYGNLTYYEALSNMGFSKKVIRHAFAEAMKGEILEKANSAKIREKATKWAEEHFNDELSDTPNTTPLEKITNDAISNQVVNYLQSIFSQDLPLFLKSSKSFTKQFADDRSKFIYEVFQGAGTLNHLSSLQLFSLPPTESPLSTMAIIYLYYLPNENCYWFPFCLKQLKIAFFFTADSLEIQDIKAFGNRTFPEISLKGKYRMKVLKKLKHKTTMNFDVNKGEHWLLYYVSKVPYVAQHPEVTVTTSHPDLRKPANYRDENNCEISYLDVKSEELVTVSVTHEWTSWQRMLCTEQEGGKYYKPIPLTDDQRSYFLQKDQKYTYDEKAFQDWLSEHNLRRLDETVIDFAFRVIKFLHSEFSYTAEINLRACGAGGVAQGVLAKRTDCGGKALVFAATMRANKIPARLIQGQFADTDPHFYAEKINNITPEEVKMGYHCLTEFWDDGVGWVPVETTDTKGFLFGRDRGKGFLTKHFDYIYKLKYQDENGKEMEQESWYLSGFYPIPLHEENHVYQQGRMKYIPTVIE